MGGKGKPGQPTSRRREELTIRREMKDGKRGRRDAQPDKEKEEGQKTKLTPLQKPFGVSLVHKGVRGPATGVLFTHQ